MSSGIRWDIEEVRLILSNLGYRLISKQYVNARTNLIIEDKHRYLYYSRLGNLTSGKVPKMVSRDNPFSIRNINQFIQNNNLRLELLSCEYINSKQNLVFRCKCGVIYQCAYDKFAHRKKHTCNKCSSKIKARKRLHNIDFIKSGFIKEGYKPLFDRYNSCEEKLLCMDGNGYKGYLSYANLTQGFSFGVFKINNPFIIDNMNHYIINNNIDCELLNTYIKNFKDRLSFRCGCGNIFTTTWSTFTDQKVYRCAVCSKKQSKYSLIFELLLNNNNISYTKEKTFSDCKDKSYLFFDYCLYFDNEFVLVEIDGEFHYTNPFGEELLEGQIKRDIIKNTYCETNEIKLIRVPYWEFEDNRYIETLEKGIKQYNHNALRV